LSSFPKLNEDIFKLSHFLKKKIKKQDVICADLENSYFYIVLYLTSFYNNYIIAPINKNSTLADKEMIINILKPKIFIKKEINLDKIELPSREKYILNFNKFLPNSIFFSSGTTENPKGIIHNYNSLSNSAKNFINTIGKASDIRFLSFLPMSYMGGVLNSVLNILLMHGTIYVVKEFDYDLLKNIFLTINKFKINSAWLTPTNISLISKMHKNQKCKYLKKVFVGMAPLSHIEKIKFKKKFNINCLESYGTSEALFVSCKKKFSADRSSGKLLDRVNVSFFKREIIVKSNSLMVGYYKSNKDLKKKKNIYKFKTGDAGYYRNNKLFITDRLKDVIIKGGENILPSEIETKIKKCRYVKDVLILSKLDQISGEEICAAIIPHVMKKKQIENFIKNNIHSYYRPSCIKYFDKFPINSNGKILKKEIIKKFK
jgi:long-chain acyl-CoA synthetase